ncbi:homeobox protein DBX2 isoform X2 [Anolis carolinensis]|uniref:homeobox protein DBX2 isoform X2 n=1 Tax=Anolis carolinensis TaxID=28377 RepID=UPI002F2B36B5
MLPRAGSAWPLLPFPAAPSPLGPLGQSFLIENLLRGGGGAAARTPLGLPASPVPLRFGPSGGWEAPPHAAQREASHPALPKHFFLRAPLVYSPCCGGSCQHPASPTVFPRQESVLPLLTQDSRSRRGILRRAVFSEEQRKALEKMFQKQKYISKSDRKKLALGLGLKESQNRRMKWRNSKEKEVLSNRCLPEDGLQEAYLSKSSFNFTSSPCPAWEMSEQQPSSKWQNLPEYSERLNSSSNSLRLPTRTSTLYLHQQQGTEGKAVALME